MPKIDEDSLKILKGLRDQYREITVEIGRNNIDKIQVERRLEDLKERYYKLTEQENKIIEKLTEKYGDGSVDIETGEFTPIQKK